MMDTVNGLLEELERIGWKYRDVQEMEDGKAHVACDVTGKSAQVTFHFFFDADSHALSLRVFKLFATPIDKRLQIIAGAGTGKTHTLIARIAFMVQHGVKPENILLICPVDFLERIQRRLLLS